MLENERNLQIRGKVQLIRWRILRSFDLSMLENEHA